MQYLDLFWASPAERGSFPRCGPNPWCEKEEFLAVLGELIEKVNEKTCGVVRIGGLFTDAFASYLKLRLGDYKVGFYLPDGWEKPVPIVFFSTVEDLEKNDKIAGLWNGFIWKVDVAEPTGFSKFLERYPFLGARIDELSIRIYDEEGVQDWVELFQRLGREATRLAKVSMYWDQLSRETTGDVANVLSRDEGIIDGLACIKVKHGFDLVGKYAVLLVSFLEEKMLMVGRKMADGNHELRHQRIGRENEGFGVERDRVDCARSFVQVRAVTGDPKPGA